MKKLLIVSGGCLFALLVTLVVLRLAFFELYRIPSTSMLPALAPDDFVLAAHGVDLADVERGELVFFEGPGDAVYVKRVVGLPGDVLELRANQLTLNGQPCTYGASTDFSWETTGREHKAVRRSETCGPDRRDVLRSRASSPHANFGPVTVPAGHLFVLGDNRDNSVDSRVWGPVAEAALKGRLIGDRR